MCKARPWFRRKDKQVRIMHKHTEEVLYLLCFRSEGSSANQWSGSKKKDKHSRPKHGQSSSWRAVNMPNLERELRFGAKPRAGALIWNQTSSESSVLEQNLERELWFGGKPRAGAPLKCKTSSGSAFEVQNLERERIRSVEQSRPSWLFQFSIQIASAT